MPVVLATEEAEIRRIMVQNQPQANGLQDPISKTPPKKKRLELGFELRASQLQSR
jgi:hypothetical protein